MESCCRGNITNLLVVTEGSSTSSDQEQAFDRVHRLGQTRDVNIYKLTIENTVEDRIQLVILFPLVLILRAVSRCTLRQLQDKKRELIKAALDGDGIMNTKLGMNELLALFRH